ncbi:restriction endonuclease subunit S [Campylobacter lanienae]|uniref:restriction endonuclease subunit S n=1 Tax=Campylobacter lanienae TaxID=75658 RepID=UPI00389AF7A6
MKSKRKSGKIPLVTAGEQNQGVAEFIAYDDELKIYENHLTIDMFCNCFYRNYKFLCDDNILVLLPKVDIGNKSLLFMTSAINKDKTKFGYEKQYRQKSFAEHKIKLPITASGEIDFEFMESFVAELEAERVAELEAYLAAASLKDYELTADELSALSKFENYNWGEFRIGDLFDKLSLKFLKSNFDKSNDISKIQTTEFSLPLVNAKDGDNGIMYYGRECDFESAEMTIDIVNDGAVSTGNVYAQPQKTGVLYNAYLVKPKFENITKEILIYLATATQKSIKLKFSYELKASWERVKNESIKLPITANGEIDFEFMNNFIKAIKKLVIKDVVLYTDNKIKATKSIVSSNQ